MPWDRIVGHSRIVARLRTAIGAGRLHPALLFEGPEGIGKRLVAVTLAQALHCPEARDGDPCGRCRTCVAIEASAAPEMVAEGQSAHQAVRFVGLSRPDEREGRFGASSSSGEVRSQIAVSQIRVVLSEASGRAVGRGPRCIVLDPADRLGESAANALLKTLEEPAACEQFILISSRPSALLPTILSRCCRLRFSLLSPAEVRSALAGAARSGAGEASAAGQGPGRPRKAPAGGAEPGSPRTAGRSAGTAAPSRENFGAAGKDLALIASLSGGRVGRAIRLAEGPALASYRETRELLLQALQALAAGLPGGTFAIIAGASFRAREREDWVEAIGVLEVLLRDLAVLALDPGAEITNIDIAGALGPLAAPLGARAAHALPLLDGVRSDLRLNVNGRLAAERILLEIAR